MTNRFVRVEKVSGLDVHVDGQRVERLEAQEAQTGLAEPLDRLDLLVLEGHPLAAYVQSHLCVRLEEHLARFLHTQIYQRSKRGCIFSNLISCCWITYWNEFARDRLDLDVCALVQLELARLRTVAHQIVSVQR